MKTVAEIVAAAASGSTFSLRPEDVGMSLEEFDALVASWIDAGEGPGFHVIKTHSESQSGHDYCDLLVCQKAES
ncbi:hypothetical protein [Bordetella petrii]|uniref:hypothetical protein n=1 Tax=Bordetella petrii TaxID=94624 RepID=UPI000576FD04|nr:hypothetical protein [Bordetella petrii]